MIKKLIFATGFGAGFVVGSASGRKSYESLKQNALKTWQDPKVQEKVSGGTEWVKSEVPVVGGKLADTAQKAKEKAPGSTGGKLAGAAQKAEEKAPGSSSGGDSSGSADAQAPEPATTDSPMDPAEPRPSTDDQG